jgi:hypothetical protein
MADYDNNNRGSDLEEREEAPRQTGRGLYRIAECRWRRVLGQCMEAQGRCFRQGPRPLLQHQARRTSSRAQAAISQRAQATIRKPDPISSGRSLKEDMDDDMVRSSIPF